MSLQRSVPHRSVDPVHSKNTTSQQFLCLYLVILIFKRFEKGPSFSLMHTFQHKQQEAFARGMREQRALPKVKANVTLGTGHSAFRADLFYASSIATHSSQDFQLGNLGGRLQIGLI